MILRFVFRALWAFLWLVFLSMLGCGGALEPETCPAPAVVQMSPELLQEAEVVSTPAGCTCDAPIRCALCSSNVGYCVYTFEARCDGCTVDVTWRRGEQL